MKLLKKNKAQKQLDRIEDIYAMIIHLSPEERKKFLETKLADKPSFREAIESYLQSQDAKEFLAKPIEEMVKRAVGESTSCSSIQTPGAKPHAIGRYELIRPIGKGQTGTVYEGWDPVLNRKIALKTFLQRPVADAAIAQRFKEKALILAKLQHPNIVSVHASGVEGDLHYIAMELVGKKLSERIHEGPLPLPQALKWCHALLQAISFAHRKRVLHRNIKPSNILIAPDGKVKMIGFRTTNVEPNVYTAPEVLDGKKATVQSDIYSLGTVFYEMVTGVVPFSTDGIVDNLRQTKSRELRSPYSVNSQIPEALDRIILKMCEGSCEIRYSSIDAVAHDMNKFLGTQNDSSLFASIRSKSARRNHLFLFSVVVIVLIALGAGHVWRSRKKTVVTSLPSPLNIREADANSPFPLSIGVLDLFIKDEANIYLDGRHLGEFSPGERVSLRIKAGDKHSLRSVGKKTKIEKLQEFAVTDGATVQMLVEFK